jgi:pyruvate dehydrogenase E2 component (dihydrolipoamide acetyltransferase)
MSVSVSMPQLGESVTEGTVTRWLKKEGERVEADEPLLEVSTDKVDTEIPSPVSGILRGITVAEDETVAVGAELAVIDEDGSAAAQAGLTAASTAEASTAASTAEASTAEASAAEASTAEAARASADTAGPAAQDGQDGAAGRPAADGRPANGAQGAGSPTAGTYPHESPAYPQPPYPPAHPPFEQPPYELPEYPPPAPGYPEPPYQQPAQPPQQPAQPPQQAAEAAAPAVPPQAPPEQARPAAPPAAPPQEAVPQAAAPQAPAAEDAQQAAPPQETARQYAAPGQAVPPPQAVPAPPDSAPQPADRADAGDSPLGPAGDGPYVTPLVRKLAAEHGIDLGSVSGTGVGGRIRKQDVIDAARALGGPGAVAAPAQQAPAPAAAPAAQPPAAPAAAAPAPRVSQVEPAGQEPDQAAVSRPAVVPSSLRGTTEHMSRARQLIAKRMVESLQVSAQLTTVVEADVTAIARLRDRAKADFEAREGVKLSFLPFFALAAVEALKVHPRLNAVIDTASAQVTYHDAEHLGIAVDTDRGLMVPVIRKAGDLNIAGLARKIADLAQRTRAARVSPDELSGGTFTLTNTGSRGALFDTPIINQPQVAILGTGTVVKRPVVVEDPALGEVITVRSMVYLALTYDHRLVDGADAARFLVTMKSRLEEGAFETELGL